MILKLKPFKKSIEYNLNKHYEELPFLKEYLVLDKLHESDATESYLLMDRKKSIERLLKIYTLESFNVNNSYIGTIYKTENYYYLIK